VDATLRRERVAFAAKVRGARTILGWSQRELGARVSMTQKSIYRMELGTHDLRRSTVVMVEQVLKAEGIGFEELPGGGFKVVVPEVILSKLVRAADRVARTKKDILDVI
jgi:predicted transcriptional regulator